MNHLNSCLIEGVLEGNPVCTKTTSGTDTCVFNIKTSRYFKKDGAPVEETSFFPIETWGRLALSCNAQLRDGRGIRVVGRLKEDRWEVDGVGHSRIKIIVEHVEFKPLFK